MPRVDFVYDRECPNVKAARANLMHAFSRASIAARWEEHQIGSVEAPQRVRGYGSPTILVDGVDVADQSPGAEASCRLYSGSGVPEIEIIATALNQAAARSASAARDRPETASRRGRWASTAAILPGVGVALMPKIVCPLCWPAYAGVLSAAGLTFLMEDRWLLPISAVLLAAALGALAWRAKSRRGYGPLLLGALSAVVVLAGKFALASAFAVYAGATLLVTACVWNAWPRRATAAGCPACPRPRMEHQPNPKENES